MKRMFKVETTSYKTYFVMADGYDEAVARVEKEIVENDTNDVLSSDGSLNQRYKTDEIKSISPLGDKILR